jgi:NAD+ synthase (glutamine-hydrolysing)
MEEGSWRQQVDDLEEGHFGPSPRRIRIKGDFGCEARVPAPQPYWMEGTQSEGVDKSLAWLAQDGFLSKQPSETDLPYLELELALCLGLREYAKKCGIERFVLALSGGRDSSMVAVLIHRMFHYDGVARADIADRFFTAYMGTDNSGSATRTAAAMLSNEIGATHYEGGIQPAVDTHLAVIREMTGVDVRWDNPAHDVPLQNVQARLRGSLIWMIANLKNGLLLSTSNKSEAAVGYATMDGDTSGGLSPISDVPKSMIGRWLRWVADTHGYAAMEQVLGTPATAELRPPDQGQTDEDDLMPYDILDRLMFHFVQLGQDPLEMFQALWPALSSRYDGPEGLAAHVRKFVRMLCFAQWKRERFAISFRVTAFDLDPKTGFRFPPVQAPFTEEIADMDAYVRTLS